MKNAVGREIPERIGDYIVKPYTGAYTTVPLEKPVHSMRTAGRGIAGTGVTGDGSSQHKESSSGSKILPDIKAAVLAAGLQDGMTVSFHHSFREGDETIGQVLTAIRDLGIKGLKFAPSAVVNIKNPSIVDFVKDGTIDRIEASGIRGDLGDAVLEGVMENPVILRTHGARPRAIEAGELNIDVAFISASAADEYGNATGQIGPNACGSLGYSFIDATNAGRVVVITDYPMQSK